MTSIARNGISGLALRIGVISFAAIMFGCVPRAMSDVGSSGERPAAATAEKLR